MGKKLAIEHHLIRPNEVIELLEMMGGKNKDNADGCSFLYYTLCTPKINNPNNDKVICGFTNLKMQNDFFAIFTLEKFWEKYPYKLNDLVLCDDGLLGVITKMKWDCEKSDMKYYISFKIPVDNKWYSSKNIKCKFMEAKGKKLAILGHKTRGNEVIELLKMIGGKICTFDYDFDGYAYYIDTSNMIICSNENTIKRNLDKYQLFTLEEFWEKYPFKIGDKVIDTVDGCHGIVEEMKWDEGLSDMKYRVSFRNGVCVRWYVNDSINFYKIKKDENLEEALSSQDIDEVVDNLEKISIKNHKMGPKSKLPSKYYEDKMEETQSKRDIDKSEFIIKHMILPNKIDDKLEYEIIDGYEFDKVDNNKIIFKPIKPKYPKTYKECCGIVNACPTISISYDSNEDMLYNDEVDLTLLALRKLFICRNAYWKIAGEEMGLDKPWKPDWCNEDKLKYCIECSYGTIDKTVEIVWNCILSFPTEEMRDAFYENFKDLIEQCKELL